MTLTPRNVKEWSIYSTWTLALLVIVLAVAACNTTQGFGKDVEKAGEGIQGAAEDAK